MGKLLERGIIPKIQAKTGHSKGHISKVISGHANNPDIQREYARICRVPVRKLFPQHDRALKNAARRQKKEAANG